MSRRQFATLIGWAALWLAGPASAQTTVFINEIHYDNTGADTNEALGDSPIAWT